MAGGGWESPNDMSSSSPYSLLKRWRVGPVLKGSWISLCWLVQCIGSTVKEDILVCWYVERSRCSTTYLIIFGKILPSCIVKHKTFYYILLSIVKTQKLLIKFVISWRQKLIWFVSIVNNLNGYSTNFLFVPISSPFSDDLLVQVYSAPSQSL